MTWSLLTTKIRIQGNGTSGKPGVDDRNDRNVKSGNTNLACSFNLMIPSKRLYEKREIA